MKLLAHTPLKPLELSRSSHGGVKAPTRLSSSDMSGIISHPKRDKSDGSPLHPTQPATQHDRLVEQTKRWVAQTFFGTLLKQMHESPFKSELFQGGRGGQAFGQMYDQRLVEHMAGGSGNKLVNAIVRKIEAKTAKSAKTAKTANAAYEKQGAMSRVAPPARTAANGDAAFGNGGGSSSRSGQDRPTGDRRHDTENPFKNVRVHVAPGL